MPKKAPAAEKETDQLKRFKAKAKELGVNEDPEFFDAALKKIVPSKSPKD